MSIRFADGDSSGAFGTGQLERWFSFEEQS